MEPKRRAIPEIQILPVRRESLPAEKSVSEPTDLRESRVEEFLQARSLAPKTQRAYRQDLQQFLNWSDQSWANVTPRQIAQFKAHLMRTDLETKQRVLSDATVRRVLGTIKNFFGWMARSRYIPFDPTAEVELPKLTEPEAQNLNETEVEQIYQAIGQSSMPERNLALISVLLHGLRANEVSALNREDFDGRRLRIRQAKADSKGFVPLTEAVIEILENYLVWRQQQGEVIQPISPLFVSHSRRNRGQRLSYEGIRKVVDVISEKTEIDFYAHRCRHTFATNLVLKGMNPYHVMTLTRHRSVQSFRRYTKAADQAAAEAAFYEIGSPASLAGKEKTHESEKPKG
ncbi:integrase domain protein SAM domain protein (plasmid) [Leptolyngbya sp. NIES-3755]|nr:integrase domain protein SAM domain protein [Leptolyngbya sp. NIES-3755]